MAESPPPTMRVSLQYGSQGLDVDIPSDDVTLVEPTFVPALADERAAFHAALRAPIGRPALKTLVAAGERVAVVIPDITRPLPTHRLLPWLFAELAHVPAEQITIIVGTGSHRANTRAELEQMVGSEVVARYRIVNHDAHDAARLRVAGQAPDGRVISMNRDYLDADRRIVLGFIEPHFMAGFSGGYKGIFPAVADIASIMHYHRASVIGHERSTWGVLDGNPTQEHIRAYAALVPLDFCINVTLNKRRELTGVFAGDPILAHEQGAAFAKATAMVACREPFPIVVTTNGGHPLDQNLYQAVKGMSAAAQITAAGGLIVAAARCGDGFPAHGNFKKLLFEHGSPRALLDTILTPGFSLYDQWEAQLFAMIRLHARVALYSEIPAADVARAHLEPTADIAATLSAELRRLGKSARIAVLPEGPMTIPYLG
ncbi:MAG TPA: nickel-dependent lactate racemase [Polyangiaceae bacterium]|nr:nickel-dependent lactate racemase [Polyangiaceae bacterium]